MKKTKSLLNSIRRSRESLPKEILADIERMQNAEKSRQNLIAILRKVQDHFGYLSPERMEAIAQLMQIPAAQISGVASFYNYFRLKPCGHYTISVCIGTACYVREGELVLKKLEEELGITCGETTRDGLFTLEATRCLGTCALAPVVKVGSDVHPQMTPDKVPALIAQYLKKNALDADP